MSTPLLSACLSNYNHSRYLKQCFAGLLNQTFTDFEIIITDDGSTDGSQDIIREFEQADSRIKANYFPANQGISAAFKDFLSRATGRYIYGGAADDFIANKVFFKNAITALETDKRPAGFYGLSGLFSAETEKLTGAMGVAPATGYNPPLDFFRSFLTGQAFVPSTSTIWRRDLYMAVGGNHAGALFEALGPQYDYYINHTLALQHGIYFEKTLFACMRTFAARTNYGSKGSLWEVAVRFSEVEKRLRSIAPEYAEADRDWVQWRALWMVDAIEKSGVRLR